MEYVVPLSRVGLTNAVHVGRKAAVLGELIRAGFPVPDGFVVTTSAAGAADDTLAVQVGAALIALGGGPVAVRSSGVAEATAAGTSSPSPPDTGRRPG